MHVDTATRAELETAVIDNDQLCQHLGGMSMVMKMDTETLRDKITDWIIEGNEATCN